MSTVDKLKRLHKQTLLEPSDIGRVVVADEAGVNVEEYLGRARTLKSLLSGDSSKEEANVELASLSEIDSSVTDTENGSTKTSASTLSNKNAK